MEDNNTITITSVMIIMSVMNAAWRMAAVFPVA